MRALLLRDKNSRRGLLANATPRYSSQWLQNIMGNQYGRLEGANCKAPHCHKGHGGFARRAINFTEIILGMPLLIPETGGDGLDWFSGFRALKLDYLDYPEQFQIDSANRPHGGVWSEWQSGAEGGNRAPVRVEKGQG